MNRLRLFGTKNRRLFQGLFGASLLAIVIWRSQPKELYAQLCDAPLHFLIPWVIGYYLIVVLTWAIGIYYLLRRISTKGLWRIIDASFKLQILSAVTPGRLGDLGLLYFLRDKYSLGQTGAVFLVDKMITLLVNVTLASFGIGIIFSWGYFSVAMFLFVLGFSLFMWLALKCPQDLFQGGIMKRILSRFQGFRLEMYATLKEYRGICINLALTALRFLFAGVSMVVILLWFGVEVSLFKVILIQAIVQFATFLPLTIMGLGIQEAFQVFLFGLMGVAPEIVLAAGIWTRAIYLAFIILTCLFWFWAKPSLAVPDDENIV